MGFASLEAKRLVLNSIEVVVSSILLTISLSDCKATASSAFWRAEVSFPMACSMILLATADCVPVVAS